MGIRLSKDQIVPSSSVNLIRAAVVGLAVGVIAGGLLSWRYAPLLGWDVAVLVYVATTWRRVLGLDADLVKKYALREDPSRVTADIVLICASVASLVAVALLLLRADGASGAAQIGRAALGLGSVVLSWVLVHTVYALRYAELYYRDENSSVDFGDTKTPIYVDFAYLAFTLGMTFQVSDTVLKSRQLRRTALRHAFLSYLFGTIIIASTINLIGGLGK